MDNGNEKLRKCTENVHRHGNDRSELELCLFNERRSIFAIFKHTDMYRHINLCNFESMLVFEQTYCLESDRKLFYC